MMGWVALAVAAGRGGRVALADLTMVCERLRNGPDRAAMVARLAEMLRLEPERCSVKATTTGGLGFAGRAAGVAAPAVATLRLPA
ncbi:MAG: 2-C-methyl-D-erythritol 2,4-cyclodiphosphate synthase [Pseudomonadota bacterium]